MWGVFFHISPTNTLGNREMGRAERTTDQATTAGERKGGERWHLAVGGGGAAGAGKQDWLSTRGFEEAPFPSPVLPPRRS